MSETRTVWEQGHAPGRRVVALAVAATGTATALDLAVDGRLGGILDLVFVVVCVGAALRVQVRDLFVVGVMPPLLMLGICVVVGVPHPAALGHRDDGVVQAVVSGLSHHSIALGLGYALCLAVLGLRERIARGSVRPGGLSRLARDRVAGGATGGAVRTARRRPPPPAAPRVRPATSRRRWSARQESLPPR